ncbi:hypothetical protein I4U23_018995 [Adineta vaga]|nr:hypothetical protein I4U23_018995 [Adineta vaga]
MSLSKLESLPNELLCDMIEKYINGIDLVMALNFQLNHRFDMLIAQSQRLRFNFTHCKKDDFRFCMGLLGAYLEKIEELTLSDEYTPGQIYGFLAFYPTFESFKYLRRLYFRFNGDMIDESTIERALQSIRQTSIETLSIEANNASSMNRLRILFHNLFFVKSLKKLSIHTNLLWLENRFQSQARDLSNIEYLAISGTNCALGQLQYILQCIPHLKYLKIQVSDWKYNKSQKADIIQMFELRTLILFVHQCDLMTMEHIARYVSCMPTLRCFEVTGFKELMNVAAWEMLLQTSLPLLTHFTLQISLAVSSEYYPDDVSAMFSGSFWMSKKNFNVIIVHKMPREFSRKRLSSLVDGDMNHFDKPVTQCWILPNRKINENLSVTNKINKWLVGLQSENVWNFARFNSVIRLEVCNMDKYLLNWIIMSIDCTEIKELSIENTNKNIDDVVLLFNKLPSIQSLEICIDFLIDMQNVFRTKYKHLRRLDISCSQHKFNEKEIATIATFFPHLEHLSINTLNLHNVPLLRTYLPYLRSLTFKFDIITSDPFASYNSRSRKHALYDEVQFLFEINGDFVTVWIDQATFKDPYWLKYSKNPPVSDIVPLEFGRLSGKNRKKENGLRSFLNFFK